MFDSLASGASLNGNYRTFLSDVIANYAAFSDYGYLERPTQIILGYLQFERHVIDNY